MKKILFILAFIPMSLLLQPTVYEVEPVPNEDVSYSANLDQGVFMDDLSWAWDSSNACFPATQQEKFTGKHVLFTGIIPAYSEISVTVIPEDEDANFSIYAYEIGAENWAIVPELPSCIRCEADHKRERRFAGKPAQDHTRTVSNLIALKTPYRMVIGVTGADGLSEGDFTLVISTKTK